MGRYSAFEKDGVVVFLYRDGDVTEATVSVDLYSFGGGYHKTRGRIKDNFEGHGVSKKVKGDVYDETIGDYLAIGRAFENLSKQLVDAASGLVKHEDDMRDQQVKQAKNKKDYFYQLHKEKKEAKRASKATNQS